MMGHLMDDIVETAQKFVADLQAHFDSPLDYSVESLKEVDKMLGAFGETELTEDELSTIVPACCLKDIAAH